MKAPRTKGMKVLRTLCVALMAIAVLLLPYYGFAESTPGAGPEWNISVEYRYLEGKEKDLDIPETIVRFEQNYRLIGKQPPVPESSLPVTRLYTWHIEGILTEEEKTFFEESEGVSLIRTEVEIERNVDKVVTIGELPSNNVDAIPFVQSFEVESATSETGVEMKEFKRSAVKFEVEGMDEWGLPNSYKATVVYRMLETYVSNEFYKAVATYTTREELGNKSQYVIVATYAPENVLFGIGDPNGGFLGVENGAVTPPIDIADGGEGAELMTLHTEGSTPGSPVNAQAGDSASGAKILSLIPVFIAIAFALFSILLLDKEYKRKKENEARREARRAAAMRSGRRLASFD